MWQNLAKLSRRCGPIKMNPADHYTPSLELGLSQLFTIINHGKPKLNSKIDQFCKGSVVRLRTQAIIYRLNNKQKMFLRFWVAYKILVHCDYFQVRKICLILWDLPLCSPVLSHTFLPITEAWSEGWLLSVREGERPTPAITARTLFKSKPTNVHPPFYIFWLGFRDAQRRPGKTDRFLSLVVVFHGLRWLDIAVRCL